MRTLQRFATVCFIGAAFAALFSACSSTDPAPTMGGAGAGTAGAPAAGASSAGAPAAGAGTAGAGTAGGGSGLTGNAANGATLYKSAGCNACHGENAEGTSGPNITGNMTAGIGGWTEAQFHDAVRSGKNRKGTPLCQLMTPFTESMVSEQGVADIYAFCKSKDSAAPVAGAFCTPNCLGAPCTGNM